MGDGFGPYGIIGSGEVAATLTVIALAMIAFVWMAYRTRRIVPKSDDTPAARSGPKSDRRPSAGATLGHGYAKP